jgi:hypothetical protein
MNEDRAISVGLIVGWVALVLVVGFTAWQTQTLIKEQDQVLANQNRVMAEQQELLTTTRREVCGSWLGTYQFLNLWAGKNLLPAAATDARERFVADFKAHCPRYAQKFS